jgi:hypothetical protein
VASSLWSGRARARCIASASPSSLSYHVGETLGGLSRPRTIVFIDTLPAELPEDDIRHGLRALCSARGSGATLNVSGSELLEPAQARART